MRAKRIIRRPLIWITGYLLAFDLAINLILPYPKDPRNISPSALEQFFEYGRSVEGKLARMTRRTQDKSAPILATGWLQDAQIKDYGAKEANKCKPIITVYGMSHSVQLAEDMAKVDQSFTIRSFAAPGAVPTWSYAAFLSDAERVHSDVVVLSLMTRGVPFICTTSGTTNHFDLVWPYTYPRYFVNHDQLESVCPPFMSMEGYRHCYYSQADWGVYLKWLNKYDKFFDPLLYRRTFLDNSSLVRLLRRGYAYSSRSKREARVYDAKNGFNASSEEAKILKRIIEDFAVEARKKNSLPVVYLVNNVLMSDHLYRLLEPTLTSHRTLFLSTHEIVPPNDPSNYLRDSHFIPAKNLELAKAMVKIIRNARNAKGQAGDEETDVRSARRIHGN